MPDENDIVVAPYQVDLEGLARFIYQHLIDFEGDFPEFYDTVAGWWYLFSIGSFMLSTLFLMGIVYSMIRYEQLSHLEQEALREAERAYRQGSNGAAEDSRWQQVLSHVSSENPNDWRLAIIEADIMLDELLNSLGFVGSSIGEKLKTANTASFASLQDAWDAHKVRNDIAHRGSDFVLTKRIAQDTIAQYKRVFEEFKFI